MTPRAYMGVGGSKVIGSWQYLPLRKDILQKTVVGCPWFAKIFVWRRKYFLQILGSYSCLPHTNTVILLEPYCGTITKPGLPVKSLTVLDASVPTTFKRLLRWLARSCVIDYCRVFWNSSVLFLSTVYIN